MWVCRFEFSKWINVRQLNGQQSEVCKLYDIYRSGMDNEVCARGFFSCQIYGFDYHENTRATSFILVVHRVVDYLTLRIISFIYMPIIIINMREWICGYGIILLYFFNVVSFTSYPTKAPHFSYGRFYSHSQQMVCRYACVRVFNV